MSQVVCDGKQPSRPVGELDAVLHQPGDLVDPSGRQPCERAAVYKRGRALIAHPCTGRKADTYEPVRPGGPELYIQVVTELLRVPSLTLKLVAQAVAQQKVVLTAGLAREKAVIAGYSFYATSRQLQSSGES